MSELGHAEAALLHREIAWDYEAAQPAVAPGTLGEEDVLERIAQARLEERAQLGDTFAQRQLRRQRHFRSRRNI